jgi:hypothetical protein
LLEPLAWAGLPSMKRLQPLTPEIRRLKLRNFSSTQSPRVWFSGEDLGSICIHLQSLQSPQEASFLFIFHPIDRGYACPSCQPAVRSRARRS